MKKTIIIILIALVSSFIVSAQFSVENSGGYLKLEDKEYNLDYLIILNGIDASSKIEYTGEETIEWTYNIEGSEYNSTQKNINPENNILYTVKLGSGSSQKTLYIFTIDYSLYKADITNLEILEDENTKCSSVTIKAIGNVPEIPYTDKDGTKRTLSRIFKIAYDNSVWKDSTWQDASEMKEWQMQGTDNSIIIEPAPMKNTDFILKTDQWEEQFNITQDIDTVSYKAVAIDCHPKGTIIEREYKNEKDRSSGSELSGSGPLVVEFKANVNPVDFVYYEWFVFNTTEPNKYQRYNDPELRYTFADTGEYTVKLKATSDGGCEDTDSVNVKVMESFIEAPNAFTPNGDGMNDEWRVAYKSIEKYFCIVQNRWGRTVFKSDDPGKGWDGTINGKQAAEGTYYYVIVAYGTDVYDQKHKKAGQQIKYKLSGDINLFR